MRLIVVNRKKALIILILVICIILVIKFIERVPCIETTLAINSSKPLIVLIDAGHGGVDPGAISKNGVEEDDINLAIALKLRDLIQQSGNIALMTREEERGLYSDKGRVPDKKREDTRNRMKIVDSSQADLVISIHLNSFQQSEYYGAQTFYQKGDEESKKFAQFVQNELREVLDKNNKRVIKSTDAYILRGNNMPGILVECGFLSNPDEERQLQDETYQKKIVWAIYSGMLKYLNGK